MLKNWAFVGVGLAGLATGRALLRRELGKPVSTPTIVALRALGIGSILCVSTFATTTGVVFLWLDCENSRDFVAKMQAWAPSQRRRIQRALGASDPAPTEEEARAWHEIDRALAQAFGYGK